MTSSIQAVFGPISNFPSPRRPSVKYLMPPPYTAA
jgi:hypothetical protein